MLLDVGGVVILVLVLFILVSSFYAYKSKKEVTRKERVIKGLQSRIKGLESKVNQKDLSLTAAKVNEISMQYFSEVEDDSGFFNESYTVKIMGSILVNNLPVGQPFIVKTDIQKKVTVENVNKLLDSFVEPLMNAGINVITKKMTGKAFKAKK